MWPWEGDSGALACTFHICETDVWQCSLSVVTNVPLCVLVWGDVDHREAVHVWGRGSVERHCIFQLCCEPQTSLKSEVYLKNKTKYRCVISENPSGSEVLWVFWSSPRITILWNCGSVWYPLCLEFIPFPSFFGHHSPLWLSRLQVPVISLHFPQVCDDWTWLNTLFYAVFPLSRCFLDVHLDFISLLCKQSLLFCNHSSGWQSIDL